MKPQKHIRFAEAENNNQIYENEAYPAIQLIQGEGRLGKTEAIIFTKEGMNIAIVYFFNGKGSYEKRGVQVINRYIKTNFSGETTADEIRDFLPENHQGEKRYTNVYQILLLVEAIASRMQKRTARDVHSNQPREVSGCFIFILPDGQTEDEENFEIKTVN
ncbi:MAG: hypothetical protein ACM3IJ_03335 [Candidatus Levyibacteriota bacterium]